MNINAADLPSSSSVEYLEPSLHEEMLASMKSKFEYDWKSCLTLDAIAREHYEEKEKAGTTCVYSERLLTDSLLNELKKIALELKARIPDGSILIQVGRSPWLLQEMMKALDLNVSWITLPFSHKIGFARTEHDLINCQNHTPWSTEELPEPQKSWVASYIKFLQNQLLVTAAKLSPFKDRIYIVDYIASGESLQDALELVNKAIGVDLGIRKVGFSQDDEPYPYWNKNPTNIFLTISKTLANSMMLKHTVRAAMVEKYSLDNRNPDSFFENAHGHTFYPTEWADPVALARVSEPAPLTLTALAKHIQIMAYAKGEVAELRYISPYLSYCSLAGP